MNIILFDDSRRNHLLPLTYTRPIADLRIGILTIKEKWEKRAFGSVSFLSQDYLKPKYPTRRFDENWLIAGSIIPEGNIIKAIRELTKGQALIQHGELLAAYDSENSLSIELAHYNCIEYPFPQKA